MSDDRDLLSGWVPLVLEGLRLRYASNPRTADKVVGRRWKAAGVFAGAGCGTVVGCEPGDGVALMLGGPRGPSRTVSSHSPVDRAEPPVGCVNSVRCALRLGSTGRHPSVGRESHSPLGRGSGCASVDPRGGSKGQRACGCRAGGIPTVSAGGVLVRGGNRHRSRRRAHGRCEPRSSRLSPSQGRLRG